MDDTVNQQVSLFVSNRYSKLIKNENEFTGTKLDSCQNNKEDLLQLEKETASPKSTNLKNFILESNCEKHLNESENDKSFNVKSNDSINNFSKFMETTPEGELKQILNNSPVNEKSKDELISVQGEKDPTLLLNEIADLNHENKEITTSLIENGLLRSKFNEIMDSYNLDSALINSGKKIREWTIDDVKIWLEEFSKIDAENTKDNFLSEMIAVVKRVNLIIMKQEPRSTQILSILLLLFLPRNKGRLLQISTGEGKSTTVAMLAVILALKGQKVDVITSSSVLAKRDVKERQEFFDAFNLVSSHNIEEQFQKGPKQCYEADIVYGDVGSFQYDLLRHEYKDYCTRGKRDFDAVIIDEVDSMLVDDSSKLARLASQVPGAEYLEPLLSAAWFEITNLHKHIVYSPQNGWLFIPGNFTYEDSVITLLDGNDDEVYSIDNQYTFCKRMIIDYLSEVLNNGDIIIPSHLNKFAFSQLENWAESALQALNMEENKHYLVTDDKDGKKIIAPVDYYSTGIVQSNTKWTNGLHQFLQLKHSLKLTAEDLNTCFISNLSYFKRYNHKIFGVTGTLGSKFTTENMNDLGCGTQDLLTYLYPIDLAFVPTYKRKHFSEINGKLTNGEDEWLNTVAEHVIQVVKNRRAVLIICETIHDVNQTENKILDYGYPKSKIKRYSRDDNDECLSIDNNIDSGEIIIATNLAGRGTDIGTSETVEKNGGLHVCVTFLPDNLRVQEQAYGRTSRQGRKGTAILIVNKLKVAQKLNVSLDSSINDVSILKNLRDKMEFKKLQQAKDFEIDNIITDDSLFTVFCKFTQELRHQQNNKYKLMQLNELWGLWLKDLKDNLLKSVGMSNSKRRSFALNQLEIFKRDIHLLYMDNNHKIMQNPAYLIFEGLNKLGENNNYDDSIRLFTLAYNLDENFRFPALYNRAYAYFRQGYSASVRKNKFDQNWQHQACRDLNEARNQIVNLVIPQLESISVLHCNLNNPTENDLFKQVISKIELLKMLIKYIDTTIDAVVKCKPKNIMKVKNVYLLKEIFSEDKIPIDEVIELNIFGINQVFDVEEIKPANSGWGLLVLMLGVAQIALGAVCIAFNFQEFGVALISEGLKDIYQSIQIFKGKPFCPKDYFHEKGINLAINLALIAFDKVVNGLEVADKISLKEAQIRSAATAGVEISKTELIMETIKDVAIKTVVDIGIDKLNGFASKKILNEFKDKINKLVNSKIRKCFDNVKNIITHLLAIDMFNCNHNFRQKIYRIIHNILTKKQNIIKTIAGRIFSTYSATNDPKLNAIKNIGKTAVLAHDMSELTNFLGDFCDNFAASLIDLENNIPKLNQLLYGRMKPKINMDDADKIIAKLTQSSIVKNNELISTAICAINQVRFDEYEEHKEHIIRLCKGLHICLTQTDYSEDIDQLFQDTTEMVRGQLSSMLQGKLVYPMVAKITDPLSDCISDKLIELSDKLFHKSQTSNSEKHVNMKQKIQFHQDEEEEEDEILQKEFQEVNDDGIQKSSNPTESIATERKDSVEEIYFSEPSLQSQHALTSDLVATNTERLMIKLWCEEQIKSIEESTELKTELRKEFDNERIKEYKNVISRLETKYCSFEYLTSILMRREERDEDFLQNGGKSFFKWLMHEGKHFFKVSIPTVMNDFGDIYILGINKCVSEFTDEHILDEKVRIVAGFNMIVKRPVDFVINFIGKDNVEYVIPYLQKFDNLIKENSTEGQRAIVALIGFKLVSRVFKSVKDILGKKTFNNNRVTPIGTPKNNPTIPHSDEYGYKNLTAGNPSIKPKNKLKQNNEKIAYTGATGTKKKLISDHHEQNYNKGKKNPTPGNSSKKKSNELPHKQNYNKGKQTGKKNRTPGNSSKKKSNELPHKQNYNKVAYMGAFGNEAEKIISDHNKIVKRYVDNLVKHGLINITDGASQKKQIDKIVKSLRKQFAAYQPWNINHGGEWWKIKIVGIPQRTHTDRHAFECAKIAINCAKDPNVLLVSLNQGVKKILNLHKIKNFRPDVIVVYENGTIKLFEVRSITDSTNALTSRMTEITKALPNMDVRSKVIELPWIDYRHK